MSRKYTDTAREIRLWIKQIIDIFNALKGVRK